MLKRFVSAVVGVTCIAATVGVSAATPSVSTTTAYNAADTTKIEVTSTVLDAANGNVYTYLAYDKSVDTVSKGEDIVFIDQQTANGTTVTFKYVTDKADVGSKVKVGGKASDGTAFDVSADNTIPALATAVSVKVNDGDAIRTEVDLSNVWAYVQLSFTDTNPVSAVTVSGKDSVEWFAGNGSVWILASDLADGAVVTITTATAIEASYDTLAGGYLANDGGVKSLIVAGKVLGGVADAEYGIEIATNAEFADAVKYKALGKGSNGEFAIKLQDLANGGLTGDTVYARAYYGAAYAEKYVKLSISGDADAAGELLK